MSNDRWADCADGTHNVAGLSRGEIELKYTLLGDANLDGTVNGSDFSALSANFGQGVTLPAVAAIVEAPAFPVATTITNPTAGITDATTPTDGILKSNPKAKHRVLH